MGCVRFPNNQLIYHYGFVVVRMAVQHMDMEHVPSILD